MTLVRKRVLLRKNFNAAKQDFIYFNNRLLNYEFVESSRTFQAIEEDFQNFKISDINKNF